MVPFLRATLAWSVVVGTFLLLPLPCETASYDDNDELKVKAQEWISNR
jgi:hypothetical protein